MIPQHILAFDLAFSNCGIALLNTQTNEVVLDQISTSSKDTFVDRIKSLRNGLHELYDDYAYLTPYIAVEMPGGSQSAKAMKGMAAAIAIFYSSPFSDIPKSTYGPTAIKKYVGFPNVKGTGRKKLNIDKAFTLYPDAPWNKNNLDYPKALEEHKADALLIAHINMLDWNAGVIR